jgi:hypothetical protein
MRVRRWAGFVVVLSITNSLCAQGSDEAREVVDKAIKAHGGAEVLARAALAVRDGKGVVTLFGKDMPFTDEWVLNLPDRVRFELTIEKQDKMIHVLNGTRAWRNQGGLTEELPRERVDEIREEAYVLWLATVAPLKQDTFTLNALPDATVAGKKASVVKVSSKGHFDALLYFDKDTGLLMQIKRRAREAGLTLEKTYQFSGHKDTDGGKLPDRIIESIGGKKFSEVNSIRYQFLRKPDEQLFAKP